MSWGGVGKPRTSCAYAIAADRAGKSASGAPWNPAENRKRVRFVWDCGKLAEVKLGRAGALSVVCAKPNVGHSADFGGNLKPTLYFCDVPKHKYHQHH